MKSCILRPGRVAPRSAWWTCLFACVVAAFVVPVDGQSASQPTVTAAFLYNFAKFTNWPSDQLTATGPIQFCVTDGAVAEALQAAVAGRLIDGHALVVAIVKVGSLPRNCAVVYASDLNAKDTNRLLAALAGSSVLSVGDTSKFIEAGGVVRLYLDGHQMRFAINIDAARRARLNLSSQLLALAKLVKDRAP